MKIQYLCNIFLLIFLTFSCSKDKSSDSELEEVTETAEEKSVSFIERIPEVNDNLKVRIYELQEKIKIYPNDIELRKKFCETAYLPEKMVLITMGIARKTNPEVGEPIANSMVERSAKLDATRWALYGTNWLMYDYQPAFVDIKGNFTRNTQEIDKITVGDSLFLYLASDLSN